MLPPLPDVELALLTAVENDEAAIEKLRTVFIEALRLPCPPLQVNGSSVLSTTLRSTKLE